MKALYPLFTVFVVFAFAYVMLVNSLMVYIQPIIDILGK